eukprot:4169627-Amphidinium_carterae.1
MRAQRERQSKEEHEKALKQQEKASGGAILTSLQTDCFEKDCITSSRLSSWEKAVCANHPYESCGTALIGRPRCCQPANLS